jgi:mRNA interferase MazF
VGVPIKGEVVILPFPFSDLSSNKCRPALVLAVPRPDEIIVCQITSQTTRPEYVIPLINSDFTQGGLKIPSYIRPNHIFMADPSIVHFSAGKIKPAKLQEVLDKVMDILIDK